jgi:hypothetical protein
MLSGRQYERLRRRLRAPFMRLDAIDRAARRRTSISRVVARCLAIAVVAARVSYVVHEKHAGVIAKPVVVVPPAPSASAISLSSLPHPPRHSRIWAGRDY